MTNTLEEKIAWTKDYLDDLDWSDRKDRLVIEGVVKRIMHSADPDRYQVLAALHFKEASAPRKEIT